jgi:hypothetical protein
MVFAANIFTELEPNESDALLAHVALLLSENGVLINAEAHRNYTMRQRPHIVKTAKNLGLHMYYPCPPDLSCPTQDCWMWRKDEFECPDITVRDEALETTMVQKAHWIILCKSSCSIYDVLRTKSPNLTWGVAAQKGQRCEICTPSGLQDGPLGKHFERGSFIGYTDDWSEVEHWDILS